MAVIKIRKYSYSVYVIYSHGNKKFKLFTGAKVDDQYWVNNSLKKHCPENLSLEKYSSLVTPILMKLIIVLISDSLFCFLNM